jgi:hypothetical protein
MWAIDLGDGVDRLVEIAGAHNAPIAVGISRHPRIIRKMHVHTSPFLRQKDIFAQCGYRIDADVISLAKPAACG